MSATDVTHVVHPGTGEVLEHLDQQPPEALAEALDAINAREAELKQWRDPLEAELRRRLKLRGRTLVVFGDWEVSNKPAWERDWDVDETERVLRELVDAGIVRAAEVSEVIPPPRPAVSRSHALQLRNRLTGDAQKALDACWEKKEKRAKVVVARSVQLLPAGEPVEPSTGAVRASSTSGSSAGPAQPTSIPLAPQELFA